LHVEEVEILHESDKTKIGLALKHEKVQHHLIARLMGLVQTTNLPCK